MKKILIVLVLLSSLVCAGDNYYYHGKTKRLLTPQSSVFGSNANIDYYEDEKKIVVGVSNKLIVKLTKSQNLQDYLFEFNATVVKSLGGNLYLLKVADKNQTLTVANRLSEKEDVLFAHPDFVKRSVPR